MAGTGNRQSIVVKRPCGETGKTLNTIHDFAKRPHCPVYYIKNVGWPTKTCIPGHIHIDKRVEND
jgi:hypothetical protein